MVQVAMAFINEAPDQDKKLSLIETLRTVTEGKVRRSKIICSDLCLPSVLDLRRS
jgi:hypothetical protein